MSLDDMSSYDRLYTTCTSSLPTEPLLRALALCSSNAANPCFGVDCGEHGSCAGGSCQCERGYSGGACEVVDPCAGVECGGHEHCADGSCECESGYDMTPGAQPVCEEQQRCPELASPGHGGAIVYDNPRRTVGTVATARGCQSGYAIRPGNENRICQSNGTWSGGTSVTRSGAHVDARGMLPASMGFGVPFDDVKRSPQPLCMQCCSTCHECNCCYGQSDCDADCGCSGCGGSGRHIGDVWGFCGTCCIRDC